MTDLATQLAGACIAAFEAEGLDARWGAVKQSDRPELADFQCNGCMGAAKQAKMNPRELAAKIAPRIAEHEAVSRVDIAGPGFLNIVVTDAALSGAAEFVRSDTKAGGGAAPNPEKIVVDLAGRMSQSRCMSGTCALRSLAIRLCVCCASLAMM